MINRKLFLPEHEQFRDAVGKFLDTEVVPFYEQWEADGHVDPSLWQKAGEQGFLCPNVTEEYGGVGVDYRYNTIINEEVHRRGLTGIGWSVHSDMVVPYFYFNGSEHIKQKYLPSCITGETVCAVAMTEPGAGSDLQAIKTSAVLDGDEYVINGSKTFISNGHLANLYVVVCKTDMALGAKGISLILVESDTPGFSRGANLNKLGMKAQDTAELFFNDVRVPKENLIGEEGKGFHYLMKELATERLTVAVEALAAAKGAFNHTVEYVKERKAFGKAIAEFQNTQFKLAELDAQITTMQVYLDRCVELLIAKELSAVDAAKAKLMATELLGRVTDEGVQLHGGYGYMWEYPITRAYADARVKRIVGGSSEIMKIIIARDVLRD